MTFLWIGSQIPLYLFGSVLPTIYQDIGGVDRYVWFVIGYLIPNAALCPFVGAFSDMYGRQKVAIVGQVTLIIGPVITATANSMNIAVGMDQHLAFSTLLLTDFSSWSSVLRLWRRPERAHRPRWNCRGGTRQRSRQICWPRGPDHIAILPLSPICPID